MFSDIGRDGPDTGHVGPALSRAAFDDPEGEARAFEEDWCDEGGPFQLPPEEELVRVGHLTGSWAKVWLI